MGWLNPYLLFRSIIPHLLYQSTHCMPVIPIYIFLTCYTNLHIAHLLYQSTHCSPVIPIYTLLTCYTNLHIAHLLYQSAHCSPVIPIYTLLTCYTNLHIAYLSCRSTVHIPHLLNFYCLIPFFTSQSTILQLCQDRSSWVKLVPSKD